MFGGDVITNMKMKSGWWLGKACSPHVVLLDGGEHGGAPRGADSGGEHGGGGDGEREVGYSPLALFVSFNLCGADLLVFTAAA